MRNRVIEADLSQLEQQEAVVSLLDMYARDPMANGSGLPEAVKRDLIAGLRAHPTTVVFLGYHDDRAVGIALCFIGFSSFYARRLMNIHDLAVAPEGRRLGLARALLEAVDNKARELDCCKVTLEVMANNAPARALYESEGFKPYARDANTSQTLMLQKMLG